MTAYIGMKSQITLLRIVSPKIIGRERTKDDDQRFTAYLQQWLLVGAFVHHSSSLLKDQRNKFSKSLNLLQYDHLA